LTTPTSTDETTQKACLCAHQRKTTYMKKWWKNVKYKKLSPQTDDYTSK
jgi:hypothetical protein